MIRPFVIIVGMLLGGVFLLLTSQNIDLTATAEVLRNTSYSSLSPLLLAFFAFLLLKVLRWRVLLLPSQKFRLLDLLPSVVIGTAANSIISHSGEVARGALISRRFGVSPGAILATIAIERLLDVATVVFLVGLVALSGHLLPDSLIVSGYLIGLGALLGAATLMLVALRPAWAVDLLVNLASRLPVSAQTAIREQLQAASRGAIAMQRADLLTLIIFYSVAQWLMIALCIYFSLHAANIDADFSAATIVMALTVVGLMLPTAPGYLGTMQASFVAGLATYGYAAENAVAASLLYNVVITFPAWFLAGLLLIVHKWRLPKQS